MVARRAPSTKTSAIPDQGSLRPIHVTAVPVKLSVAVEPASVESFALPPLWFAFGEVLVNHVPVYCTRESVSSMRVTVGAGVGVDVGDAVAVGVGVDVAVGVGVGVSLRML